MIIDYPLILIILNHIIHVNRHCSIGSQIAAQMCRYCEAEMNEKCGMILSLDAAGVEFALLKSRFPTRNDALYVQLIITDPSGLGTELADGHDKIYIKDLKFEMFTKKHISAIRLHHRIITGHLIVIPKLNRPAHIITNIRESRESRANQIRPPIQSDACLLGIYGTLQADHTREFTVSFADRTLEVFHAVLPCNVKKNKCGLFCCI